MEPRPFVGRAEEFERLEHALRRTQSRVGSAVLVAGEAGIGKSRLASELATHARAAGFEVLIGRCIDLIGTELPYQPFADALRPWAARHGESALPWLSQVRPAGSQLRVFEETLALFSGLTVAAPVLLVLEDLHWADPSTLDLVVFLAHNLAERRMLLLATYRGDEPPRPSACAGSPTASAVPDRRWSSSSGRSNARSCRRCSRPAAVRRRHNR
jgi:predicted ATPase